MNKKNTGDQLQQEFEAVITEAHRISADVGRQVERILRVGRDRPLGRPEAVRLLTVVVETLRTNGSKRGKLPAALQGEIGSLVEQIVQARERLEREKVAPVPSNGKATTNGDGGGDDDPETPPKLELLSMHGVKAGILQPTPWFHERKVPMYQGYFKTADLGLWDGNDRLDIHLRQFEQQYGRKPDSSEVLSIMLSQMNLLGAEEDEFEIVKLANSISVNGVRKPPVLDVNGTPLDGNRRIAACLYILHSDQFEAAQKERVESLHVWQLTEHATDDDRRAVVVSLNFEDDCKEDWRKYIKVRKLFEDWQTMLLREPRRPDRERTRTLMTQLSKRYALGPNPTEVEKLIKMYEVAVEFKEYQVTERKRDEFEAEHRTDYYFEYFDELSKGSRAGVAYMLEQDEELKHLVYDLLYDRKFANWTVVRDLKYVDDEVKAGLKQAWDTTPTTDEELEAVKDLVERVLVIGRNRKKENRVGNADTRIKSFVKWLRDVPISTLQEDLEADTKQRLRDALQIAVQVMQFKGKEARK